MDALRWRGRRLEFRPDTELGQSGDRDGKPRGANWPFGDEAVGVTDESQRIRFASMERDQEGNRYYDRARSDDFNLARFLSPDSMAGRLPEPQSWNRYTYVMNRPLVLVDPDGLEDSKHPDDPNHRSTTFYDDWYKNWKLAKKAWGWATNWRIFDLLTVTSRWMFCAQNVPSNAVVTSVPRRGSDCIAGSPQHPDCGPGHDATYGGWSAPECAEAVRASRSSRSRGNRSTGSR